MIARFARSNIHDAILPRESDLTGSPAHC